MTIVRIEYVDDYRAEFFGHVIAASDVRGMTVEERNREIEEMRDMLGHHVRVVEVEQIG